MAKKTFKAGTMLNPVPPVMVSCGVGDEKNIITIAWTGIINSEPPITYISVRKSRHSHSIIEKNREFVINLCTEKLAFACDYCGVKSGSKCDKWNDTKLTPMKCEMVSCPMIEESPLNLECKVLDIVEYPSHDMFVAEIVAFHADEDIIDRQGKIRLDKANLVAYNHGEYFVLQKNAIGGFGFSVMKPKTKKRINGEKRNKSNRRSLR